MLRISLFCAIVLFGLDIPIKLARFYREVAQMPFYEPGEAHAYDGKEVNVKIYASTSLTPPQRELLSLLYNESRDADLAYQQGKTKTQYLSLLGRIERFVHEKAVFLNFPRKEWTQPLYIVKVLRSFDDASATNMSATLYIEPLDILPRWPERNEAGQLIRPDDDGSFSLVIDLSVDCWYWVRMLLSDPLRQPASPEQLRVQKAINITLQKARTAAQTMKGDSLARQIAAYGPVLSSSLAMLYAASQNEAPNHP